MLLPPSPRRCAGLKAPFKSLVLVWRQGIDKAATGVVVEGVEFCGTETVCCMAGHTCLAADYTWHDLPLWKVAREEVVICCDVLVANGILLSLHANMQIVSSMQRVM